MTGGRRVLIVSREAGIAWASLQSLTKDNKWRVVGIVDPHGGATFDLACEVADIVLIEARDLIWLLDNRPSQTRNALKKAPPMVLLEERDILAIVTRSDSSWGLLPSQRLATITPDRLDLAVRGYLVIADPLLQALRRDRQRLEIATRLSPDERHVLSYLGTALSNRGISRLCGMTESRVKTLARVLSRKLCLRSRTAVAIFAIKNGFALPHSPDSFPNAPHHESALSDEDEFFG